MTTASRSYICEPGDPTRLLLPTPGRHRAGCAGVSHHRWHTRTHHSGASPPAVRPGLGGPWWATPDILDLATDLW